MGYIEVPMGAALPMEEGVERITYFADSVPYAERQGVTRQWRRVIEAADDENEFSAALEALHTFRLFGFDVPPYSAVIETYEDGSRNSVMYVGHVEGKTFDEVDFTRPQAREQYIELGHKLLRYLPYCYARGLHYLTDITKADQFLYAKQADGTAKLVMVDLELFHFKTPYRDQLDLFRDRFIKPLEQKTGRSAWELRAHRWQVIRQAPGGSENPLDFEF